MSKTTAERQRDNAWNLIARLEACDRVADVEKGATDSGVTFVTDSFHLPTDVMEILVDFGYCVDTDTGSGSWIAVAES